MYALKRSHSDTGGFPYFRLLKNLTEAVKVTHLLSYGYQQLSVTSARHLHDQTLIQNLSVYTQV